MTAVLATTGGLLFVAGALILVRLLRGPTTYDRLVALDVLVVVVLGGILLEALWRGEGANIMLLVVVALVGFLSTVAVLRFGAGDER